MLTRRSLFACCGYLLLVQATLVLHSDEPAAKLEAEAVQLVKQLGSSSWSKRQNAQHRLNKLGPRALPALRAALRSSDLELRRRAGQLYWDIRLPKRILPPGRRRQVVTQLANGSEISRRKALRVLFRTKKIWLAPMIEQSLAGVAAEEAVQATAWLVPKLAAAKQQALWRKLRPILAKHPQWAQDYHRKQAVLRLTPELAARLWAPKLSQPGRNRYGVDHRFHRLIRSTTHKQRFWSMLLALSRLPGRHRLFLITSLRSVNQVWPKRLGQLLPGLLDEIDRSAATGRWDPEISTALFTLRRHFRNQRGQDWNRRL
ncbi:hypothetical protein JYT84_00910, partial [bacterium AH-315-M10]|nr:hypothetical protein [bacterium AH-315-M10]